VSVWLAQSCIDESQGYSRSRAERFRAAQFRAAQFRAARFSAAAALKRAARNWEQVLSNNGDRQAMVAAFTFEIGSLSNVQWISVGDKHVTVSLCKVSAYRPLGM